MLTAVLVLPSSASDTLIPFPSKYQLRINEKHVDAVVNLFLKAV